MSTTAIPQTIRDLPVGQRIKWARKRAGLSHDRLIEKIGRSNRSHLIKVEKGLHTPGAWLRDAIADATDVPRDFLHDEDEEEDDPSMRAAFELFVDLLRRVNNKERVR